MQVIKKKWLVSSGDLPHFLEKPSYFHKCDSLFFFRGIHNFYDLTSRYRWGSVSAINTGTMSLENVFLEFIHNLFHKHSRSTYFVTSTEATKLSKLCPQTSGRIMRSHGGDMTSMSWSLQVSRWQPKGDWLLVWESHKWEYHTKTLPELETSRLPWGSPSVEGPFSKFVCIRVPNRTKFWLGSVQKIFWMLIQ